MYNKDHMYNKDQLSFRFYDIDPEQLSFDFPYDPKSLYFQTDLFDGLSTNSQLSITGTTNSGLSVTQLQVTNNGLHIRQERQTWIKTKIANWLGIKYIAS